MQPITSKNTAPGSTARYFGHHNCRLPSAGAEVRSADPRYQNLWEAVAAGNRLHFGRVLAPVCFGDDGGLVCCCRDAGTAERTAALVAPVLVSPAEG